MVESKILLADQQLDKLPTEIRFDLAHAGEKLLQLNHEKKRFLDCIKVFACNLKAEMCRLLLKHYDWEKEVVPALAMIVERTGYVKLEGGRLEVTLKRFTDREIDYAARHLCEDLNRMQAGPRQGRGQGSPPHPDRPGGDPRGRLSLVPQGLRRQCLERQLEFTTDDN